MKAVLVPLDFASDPAAPRRAERRLALGVSLALALHVGVWLGAQSLPARGELVAAAITEIDLTPPPPAAIAPEPPPAAPPAPLEPERARPVERKSAPVTQRQAPPPAAAGPLHTANEDAPSAGEPLRFAVDARGSSYGFGVVAQGGADASAAGGAGSAAPRPSREPAAADPRAFATPPRLEESDPCRGYFPSAAVADRAEVTLQLSVSAQGVVQRATILREQPERQSFGRAALACLRAKRFVPARDAGGRDVPSLAPVAVRFAR